MPGVLSTNGVAASDAVSPVLAAELWRTATLLRALRCNARIHWHRLAFRVQVEEEVRIPGAGARLKPGVLWAHLDETEGHRKAVQRAAEQMQRRPGDARDSPEFTGSSDQALSLVTPRSKPVVLAPSKDESEEEPTLYVLRSRWDAEQMLMASADPVDPPKPEQELASKAAAAGPSQA